MSEREQRHEWTKGGLSWVVTENGASCVGLGEMPCPKPAREEILRLSAALAGAEGENARIREASEKARKEIVALSLNTDDYDRRRELQLIENGIYAALRGQVRTVGGGFLTKEGSENGQS